MKLTTEQQTVAILDLVIEMAAKNMAFQEFMVTYCFDNNIEDARIALGQIKSRADDNIKLLRAKVFQYSSVDPNDLLNGLFEI